jgi:hypothetical protein
MMLPPVGLDRRFGDAELPCRVLVWLTSDYQF